jgi:hypothetical protein
MARLLTLLVVVSGLFSHPARAGAIDELTPEQVAQVRSGKQVLIEVKRPGLPWPELWTYQKIDATPEEAMAVSCDYELRLTYLSDLKLAKIANVIDPRILEVNYIVTVPVIGDETFTLRHEAATYDHGQSFRMDYRQIRSTRTKVSEGSTRFEPLDSGTLMAGVAFVDPGNPLASLVTRLFIEKTMGAIQAFVDQVHAEKRDEPELLKSQVDRLQAALATESP